MQFLYYVVYFPHLFILEPEIFAVYVAESYWLSEFRHSTTALPIGWKRPAPSSFAFPRNETIVWNISKLVTINFFNSILHF